MPADLTLSPRLTRLREVTLAFADDKDLFERGRAVVETFREHANEPIALRRARALLRYLDTETVHIEPGELIVGRAKRQFSVHKGMHEDYQWRNQLWGPDFTGGWLTEDARLPDEARELFGWMQENYVSPHKRVNDQITQEMWGLTSVGAYTAGGLDFGHNNPSFEMALENGIEAIQDDARRRLASAETDQQRTFYQAAIICCDAVVRYAERYAEAAAQLAAEETAPQRRSELEQIAERCRHVPRHRPRSFHEALQAVWFIHVANEAESQGSAQCFGRFDQYLLPFYQADLDAGMLTRQQALELIECFWLKCYKTFDFQMAVVGGVKRDGSDGTNELSYLCLDALEALKTPRDVCVRIHKDSPPAFLRRAAEVAKLGLGRPDFWNDEAVIPGLVEKGISLEDARDYAVIGCVELTLPGRCNPRTMCQQINLVKCLELALNEGTCPVTGKQVGLPNENHFQTYEELHAAYRAQVEHVVALAVQQDEIGFAVQAEHFPMPFLSTLTEGCLENGRDVYEGGATYNPCGANLTGVADIADSLAAIRKLVYEEKRLTLDELRGALTSNFADAEPLRQMLLNDAPKFGNDDAYVDEIAREETCFFYDQLARYRTPEGGEYLPLIFATTPAVIYQFAPKLGATPNGRRAGDPLSASVNPSQGADRNSGTASVTSVAKLELQRACGGVSHILDVHPTAVAGEAGTDKLVSLLQTYFDQGGSEIGLNIVGEDLMRSAQDDPDKHQHLMVRLFGFSTPFVALDEETQEYVIEKTKHAR